MRVGVGGVDLALVVHRGGERQRLAAGAGAEVEDLHPGLGLREERRKLRAFVLQLDETLDVSRVGGERGRAPVGAHGDPQAHGRERRRLGLEMSERAERLVARGLEKVHPQVDRRTLSQRPALVRGGSAEARLERGAEPLGKIAGDMSGRAGKVGGSEPRALGFRERGRRMALAGEERGDRLDIEAVRLLERAQNFGARAWASHHPRGRAFLAQRVIDEARYRRPVAGAGEAVREAPILHRVGRWPAARFDVGQNFDRGCGAGGGGHGEGSPLAKWSVGSATHRGAKPLV